MVSFLGPKLSKKRQELNQRRYYEQNESCLSDNDFGDLSVSISIKDTIEKYLSKIEEDEGLQYEFDKNELQDALAEVNEAINQENEYFIVRYS
jgi:hypothetical protein